MDAQKNCILTDPNCKTFNESNGDCLTCYDGHELVSGKCIIKKGTSDPNCKTFKNDKCTECSKGYYFDIHNSCVQIDPFCKVFDVPTKKCTSCFSGF